MENLSCTSCEVLRSKRTTLNNLRFQPRSSTDCIAPQQPFRGRSIPFVSKFALTIRDVSQRLLLGIVVKLSDRAGEVKHLCIQLSAWVDIAVEKPHGYWGFASSLLHASMAPVARMATMVSAIPQTSFGDSNRNSTTCVPAGISTARNNPNAVAISTFAPST